MKLLIDKPLHLAITNPPDISDEDLDSQAQDAEDYQALFDRLGVHATVDYTDSSCSVTLYPQKIVLDEVNMNTLFADVIDVVFWRRYKIEYAALGGAGCEMAFTITGI